MGQPKDEEGAPPPQRTGPSERPDWLVGADEALESEFGSERRPALPAPKLTRPGGAEADPHAPPAVPPPPRLSRPDGGAAAPRQRLPEMDDVRRPLSDISHHVEWAAPQPRPAEAPAPVADPGAATSPPRLEAPATARSSESPARGSVAEPEPLSSVSPMQRAAAGALEAARRSWKRLAGAAAIIVLGVVVANAAGVGTTSIRDILAHPERFDGRSVRVRGRVSQDVFPVGGGFTFYLLRGRDSLVVFTRSRVPVANQPIEVQGEVSTGSVAGEDRPALLEQVRSPR